MNSVRKCTNREYLVHRCIVSRLASFFLVCYYANLSMENVISLEK